MRTLEELMGMSDRELNEMAARLMGWTEQTTENKEALYQAKAARWWVDDVTGTVSVYGWLDYGVVWEPSEYLSHAWELVRHTRNVTFGPISFRGSEFAWEVGLIMRKLLPSGETARALTIAAIMASEVGR